MVIENPIEVSSSARIAVYYDPLSAPRVVDIPPQDVYEFIEALSSAVYELSQQQGGSLPFTIIREITENFIHADFSECTVSILDGGKTLRFADQGPGITKKDIVLRPGVSSATQNMKEYIRGVGSGFPVVREYLSSVHGFMSIEDNAENGVVITIALADPAPVQEYSELAASLSAEPRPLPTLTADKPPLVRDLNEREERTLLLLNEHGMLGPVDLAEFLVVSAPTTTRLFQKLEALGMVESTQFKKRILSNAGMAYVQEFLVLDD